MLLTNKYGTAALVLAMTTALFGCEDHSSATQTNPDFNHDVLFSDYGTYGRTVYFEDVEGDTWCYYDLLTFENPEEIRLTFSAPIQNQCNTSSELPLISYAVDISGEQKTGEGSYQISTIMTDNNPTNYFYSPQGVLIQGEPRNDPLAPFISLFPAEKNIATSLRFTVSANGLTSNVLSMADYLIPGPRDYLTAFELKQSDYAIYKRVEAELLDSFGLFNHLKTELPYPETENFLFPLDVNDRCDLYTAHPYQKLSTTEANPYPLNQIRVE